MDGLNINDPQQMLEAAFRALYEMEATAALNAVALRNDKQAFQKKWCEAFVKTFSFVSEYGATVKMHETDDFHVKHLHSDKYFVTVQNKGFSMEIHAPEVPDTKSRCLELYIFDMGGTKTMYLTLPEITQHISKGCARANTE